MQWTFLGIGLFIGFLLSALWSWAQRRALVPRELLEMSESEKSQQLAVRAQMTQEFENIANKIFNQSTLNFRESNERNMNVLLNPLKDKILEFQKRVEETYAQESREMFSLKNEIRNIVEANQRITVEASRLTTALRGDVKAQGNWGELVLERILEASGLREGHEYQLQGSAMSLKSDDGRVQRPDVIINLPEGKHLIIDSKVSLIHYERAINETEEQPKVTAVKAFLQSMYAHIDGLAAKSYQNLNGIVSPDFVMMFLPMEGAFALAMQADAELFLYAWDKRIVLVSPTTLLATLRTVSSIWNQERQNKNAIEIARQGGQLYDKFTSFVEDLQGLGAGLERSNDQYSKLMTKLSEGRGNLVSRVQRLKELGAKTSKDLPAELLQDLDD
jgi:DNA recombination protein RmuC